MINYSIDDNGTLHIYNDNMIIADISDCNGMSDYDIDKLINEIIEDK